eukprot:Skav233741  [mRNA]  locus=scaffold2303:122667:127341:+ [translate_table: standard]
MNLRETWTAHCDGRPREFRDQHSTAAEVEDVTKDSELAEAQAFKAGTFASHRYESPIGKTPEFSHQFETRIDGIGVFDVHLKVVQGIIEDATIFSDALFPDVAWLSKVAELEDGHTTLDMPVKSLSVGAENYSYS